MVPLMSSSLSCSFSLWVIIVGNLPALFNPGPSSLGICLIKESDAIKESYFLANFFTSFLSLFSFFKSSTDIQGISNALASSQCDSSPSTQILILGLGTCFNLTVPENRLSFVDHNSSRRFGVQQFPGNFFSSL